MVLVWGGLDAPNVVQNKLSSRPGRGGVIGPKFGAGLVWFWAWARRGNVQDRLGFRLRLRYFLHSLITGMSMYLFSIV